jgi:hypothetical protein
MLSWSIKAARPSTPKTAGQRLLELVVLLFGSTLAGYFIAVWQHYFTFGVRGFGFGYNAILAACTEGGIFGIIFGIPTGLIAYYLALEGRVSQSEAVVITLGSLIVGCIGGLIFDVRFVLITPLVTIGIARFVACF